MILPDGTYDVIVVEASDGTDGHDDERQPRVHVSLTILGGTHRGEVVDVAVANLDRPPFDLLGLPGTLAVHEGEPHLIIDD